MKPYTYLVINLACIIVPFIASFCKKYPFYKDWKYFFPTNFIVAFAFLVWDYWFTKNGVWGFNPDYLKGIYVFNLPIEEVLFFICIPYACVFTYFVCKKYIARNVYRRLGKYPLNILLFISAFFTFICFDKQYTFFTAFFLLLSLIFVWKKNIDINLIILSYLIIIPFFLLSNGILTGSFIENPIVWYNNDQNLGIRIFSIPIEDTFYGFLLILLNVLIYERLKLLPTMYIKS